MDTTVIPSGGAAIACHPDYNYRDRDSCANDMVLLNAVSDSSQHLHNNIADGSRAEIKEIADTSRAILKDSADNSRFVGKEVSDASRFLAGEICSTSHDVQEEVCDSTRDVIKEINSRSDAERATAERLGFSIKDEVERWGYRGVKSTDEASIRSQISFKEQLLELEKAKQVLERQAADNRYTIERQAAENACAIKLLQEKSLLETLRHADKLAADASRQMAECCCELKSLVSEKAEATDKLILKIEADRIREELANAKQEILALRLRPVVPTTV